jgi:mono/diheme cytochrome c family protein
MQKSKCLATVFVGLCLLLSLSACGSSPANSNTADPTPLPYNEDVDTQLDVSQRAAAEGDPEAGKRIFEEECSRCHSTEEAVQIEGPSLYRAGDRLQFSYIMNSIENPHELKAIDNYELDMPPDLTSTLTPQEIQHVAAYVASLQG